MRKKYKSVYTFCIPHSIICTISSSGGEYGGFVLLSESSERELLA